MSDQWRSKTLEEIVSITKGVTYGSSDYAPDESGHIFLTIKCFEKGGGFNTEGLKYFRGTYLPAQEVAAGELLIAKTDLTRAGDIVGSPMITPDFGPGKKVLPSMDLSVLRALNDDTDTRFLFYRLMLGDARRFMWAHSAGSTVLHLESKAVPKFSFSAPSGPEQRQIGKILLTLEQAIAQTEALIAKHQQIKAGLMHDLFTRGVTPDGRLRPTHEQAPNKYKHSILGFIPAEWDVKLLRDMTVKIADRDHTTPQYMDDGVLIVSPTNLFGEEGIDFANCRHISVEAHQINRRKTDIQSGDLILHRIGAGLGSVRMVTEQMPEFSILHSMAVVRPQQSVVCSEFLLWMFRSTQVQSQIDVGIQSIGVPDLGLDKIGSLLFLVAPLSEQEIISQRLRSQSNAVEAEIRRLQNLHYIKNGLMQDLLTGRVRVKVPEPAAA